MRLIDADELQKELRLKVKRPTPHTIGSFSFREIMEIIESQPTVKLTVDDMPRCTHNVNVETRWQVLNELIQSGKIKINVNENGWINICDVDDDM